MRILFIDWGNYGKEDIKSAMTDEGHEVISFPFEASSSLIWEQLIHEPETEAGLRNTLHDRTPDVVFSVNYFPVISRVCQAEHIRYISWSYDGPYILLYSNTINNSCNRVYVFDREMYLEFCRAGITTVYYMPLAVNTKRLELMDQKLASLPPLSYDVSFVGSFYLEKGSCFEQIETALPEYSRGYLKAMIGVQLKIQGYDMIEEMLPFILNDLYKAYPVKPLTEGRQPKGFFYEYHVIKPWITTIERIDLLEAVAAKYTVDLFSHTKDFTTPGLHNHGPVDYFHEMPLVFKQSKINLNMTMRGIKSGIPLRAFDIMGAGGFLLSNYQEGFLEYFVPGEDFVYYESKEDLLAKVEYYLSHDEERKAIARNGHEKVAASHTYRHRIGEMLNF